MDVSSASQSLPAGGPPDQPFRTLLHDSLRYWEQRRIFYNLALAAVVIIWIAASWPHFRPALALVPFLQLLVLALIANVFYCAAYFVDLPMQFSSLRARWTRGRWALWVLGTLFAILFENYWIADEIYPFLK